MNKIYFLVLLISVVCVNAAAPSFNAEQPAMWFLGTNAQYNETTQVVTGWRSTVPSDNPMRPYFTSKKGAQMDQIQENDKSYRGIKMVNGCLKMTAYYAVQTLKGWTVALHTTRSRLPEGLMFGGSRKENTPTIISSNSGTGKPAFAWKSCDGLVGTYSGICEEYTILEDVDTEDLALTGDNDMVTVIVSYVPKGNNANTTFYVNGKYASEVVTKTSNKNWDLNAISCSGWGTTKQTQNALADFRIYTVAVDDDQALAIHESMKNYTSAYIPPPTEAPATTTPAPIPDLNHSPNITNSTCSGVGYYLTEDAQRCICNSANQGAQCEDGSANETCSVNLAKVRDANFYAYLSMDSNHSSYSAGVLNAQIRAPLVSQRKFVGITFRHNKNESRCFLGTKDTFWQQAVDECEDVFSLGMPWSFSKACGFVSEEVGDDTQKRQQYHATVEMVYIDQLLDHDLDPVLFPTIVTRRTRVTFEIYVSFPTKLDLEFVDIEVESVVTTKAFITRFEYDRVLNVVHLKVATQLDWPNKFSHVEADFELPSQVTDASPFAMEDTKCDNTFNSTCLQVYTMDLKLMGVEQCSFSGPYSLNLTTITCREPGQNCTEDNVDHAELHFTITDYDVCGYVGATPELEAVLVPYDSETFNTANVLTEGLMGSDGFFKVELTQLGDNTDNTVTMEFIDIIIYNDVSEKALYSNKAITSEAKVDGDDTEYLAVFNNLWYFKLNFAGWIFDDVLPGKSLIYTFKVKIAITYADNAGYTKREVMDIEQVYKAPANSIETASTKMSMQQETFEEAPATETTAAVNDNKMLLVTILAPLAGVVVLTVLSATAYYIYNNSNKKQTTLYSKI